MKLSDAKVRNVKAGENPIKLSDGGGLFLLVQPNGAKGWRLAYRFEGKQKLLSLGVYPAVTLKDAREKREELKRQLAKGIDPSAYRKAVKFAQGDSFEALAREWFNKFSAIWAKGHSEKIIRRLERDIFPWIGKSPTKEITPPELLAVLRRIEARGPSRRPTGRCRTAGKSSATGLPPGEPSVTPLPIFAAPSRPRKSSIIPASKIPRPLPSC
jgi:hypothetical protein